GSGIPASGPYLWFAFMHYFPVFSSDVFVLASPGTRHRSRNVFRFVGPVRASMPHLQRLLAQRPMAQWVGIAMRAFSKWRLQSNVFSLGSAQRQALTGSQRVDSRPKNRRAYREPITLIALNHLLRGDWRVDETTADPADCLTDRLEVEIEDVFDKRIRVDRPDAVGLQHGFGKVSQVECDNLLGATMNRRCQHVPVVRVRNRREPSLKLLKAAHQGVRDSPIHQIGGTFQSCTVEFRTIANRRIDPFGMDAGRPLRAKEPSTGEFDDEVSD